MIVAGRGDTGGDGTTGCMETFRLDEKNNIIDERSDDVCSFPAATGCTAHGEYRRQGEVKLCLV